MVLFLIPIGDDLEDQKSADIAAFPAGAAPRVAIGKRRRRRPSTEPLAPPRTAAARVVAFRDGSG